MPNSRKSNTAIISAWTQREREKGEDHQESIEPLRADLNFGS